MPVENKLINLASTEVYQALTIHLQNVVDEWQFEEAEKFRIFFQFYLENNPDFEKKYPNEFKTYNNFFIKTNFLTLNQLALPELVVFMKDHWVEQYDIPFYTDSQATIFFDLFDACLMGELIYEERDEWKKKIVQSLRSNSQVFFVASKGINLPDNRVSVAELMVNFENQLVNKDFGVVAITNYLDKAQKEFGFDELVRNKIGHLLKFYKVLNTSSMDAEGVEEVMLYIDEADNKLKVLKKGVIEEIRMDKISEFEKSIKQIFEIRNQTADQPIKEKEFSYQALMQSYNLNKFSWQKIVLEADNLIDYNKKTLEFKNSFHQAINDKNNIILIAHLLVLARNGYLDEIFERDDKIKEIFKKHLAKKFTEKIADHFEKNLREPVYLSYFLQHILKDILKLDENESAVLAIKLVNELKRAGDKQYLPIAYGDMKSGMFKWKGIIDKGDRLELAD